MIEKESVSFFEKMKAHRTKLIFFSVLFIVVSGLFFRFYQIAFPNKAVQEAAQETSVGVGKKTGFDGKNVNQKDPAAVQAYCDDVVSAAKSGKGSIIRDLCVLDEVVKTHLPLMSNEEIAAMAEANPSCLETGYDGEGYNCFTGYNRANCNRGGRTEQGEECEPAPAKKGNDPASLLTGVPSNICDLVSGCQSESAFDPEGFNKFGCNRQGKRKDGTTCPYEYITKIYGDDGFDQAGFKKSGFNKFNCDAQGLRPDGTQCPINEITRIYNKSGFDQLNLNEKGFNLAGCNVKGLREDGTVCDFKDIPRIIDPVTGWDQFGLNDQGVNAHGCGLSGFDVNGELCDPANIPRIYGSDNKDQFGLRKDGRNDDNCDIYGKKPDGGACPLDKVVQLFSPVTGQSQFGLFANNRNKFDCDVHGYKPDGSLCPLEQMVRVFDPTTKLDQNGLNENGFNDKNCNLQGVNPKGERCADTDIPRLINPVTKKDQFNLNSDGVNDKGCLSTGFTPGGERCSVKDIPRLVDQKTKLDQFGLKNGKNGLVNEFGCNLDGLDEEGKPCPLEKITRIFDPKTGLDQFNLNAEGYTELGCNLQGVRIDGSRCEPEDTPRIRGLDGIDQLGMNDKFRNRFDCDVNGLKSDGSNCTPAEMQQLVDGDGVGIFHRDENGFGRSGLNDKFINKFNCDINGRKPDGSLCPLEQITRIYDPVTKLDQFGLTKDGLNEFGCNLEGMDSNGQACKPEHIPRIFDKNMVDQFGVGIKDLPMDVWLAEKSKTTDLTPLLDDSGKQVFINGEPAFVSTDGVVRTKDGVAMRDADGGMLHLASDNKVRSSKGELVPVTNSDGKVVATPLKADIRLKSGMTPMVTANGEQVVYDGKEVFLDGNNNLVDRFGKKIVNEKGDALRLSESGQVVSASGKVEPNSKLKTLTGATVNGPLVGAVSGMPLTDSSGRPVFVNGEAVFVAKNGALVDKGNKPILSPSGEELFVNTQNEITNKAGKKVAPPVFSTADGDVVKEVKRGAPLMPLVNDNGERVLVDGIEAFVAADGSLVDINNRPIRNAKGEQMFIGKNGDVVNSKGELQPKDLLKTTSGKDVTGPLRGALSGMPLTTADGAQVFVDGKPAFVAADGTIVDRFNQPLKNKRGEKLSLSASGELITESGADQPFDELTTALGGSVAGKLSAGIPALPLLDANGQQVALDGKPLFVTEDGVVVDANNVPVKNELGETLRLNDKGQIETQSQQLQAMDKFSTAKGEAVKGRMKRGILTKQEKEAKKAAELLSPEVRASLGLDPDGYNGKGCDLLGLRRDGTLCPLKDTPRVFDPKTKLDQFSFGADGYNTLGCDEFGVSRGGESCPEKFITRRYGADDRDIRGISRTGVNEAGLTADFKNVLGCDPTNPNCEKGTPPQLTDSLGVNQFNVRKNGADRLNLKEFRNDKGCDVAGFKSNGERCKIADIPLLFNENNVDQFGRKENGFNAAGCGVDGRRVDGTLCLLVDIPRIFDPVTNLDQFNLDPQGYSPKGCNLQGFRKDGSRCEPQDIPRIYSADNLDQFGLKPDGFNLNGCDLNGRKKDGSLCELKDVTRLFDPKTNLDQFGLREDGFNDKSCNLQGLNRDGEICKPEDIPRMRDSKNLDQFKMDINGVNENGCDIYGYLPSGKRCDGKDLTRIFDKNNVDQHGASKRTGRNVNGCDLNNKMPDGSLCKPTAQIRFKNKAGADQFNLIDGKNENDCDINGLKPDGTRCQLKDVTRVFNPGTGVDQFGLTKDNRNAAGCGIDGRMPDGSLCKIEELVQLFDGKGVDQFGLDEDKRNASGCDLMGYRSDGSRCTHVEMPSIYGKDNRNYVGNDIAGFNSRGEDLSQRDINGCDRDNRKADGTLCDKFRKLDLTIEDGVYMQETQTVMTKWFGDRTNTTMENLKLTTTYKESDELGNQPPAPINVVATAPVFPKDEVNPTADKKKVAMPNIPMGYMTSIYVKTPVNSDYTKEVYAEITDGELAGSQLRGTIVTPYVDDPVMPRDKFYYEFNYIINNRQAIPIDAVSINMENDSGMVDADDVNYHIFQRYGGLVVGTAIDVLGAGVLDNQIEANARKQAEAIDQIASESVVFGQNSYELARQNIKVATKHASELAKLQFTRRPTISSGPGPQLIIFRSEVTNENLPLVFTGVNY